VLPFDGTNVRVMGLEVSIVVLFSPKPLKLFIWVIRSATPESLRPRVTALAGWKRDEIVQVWDAIMVWDWRSLGF